MGSIQFEDIQSRTQEKNGTVNVSSVRQRHGSNTMASKASNLEALEGAGTPTGMRDELILLSWLLTLLRTKEHNEFQFEWTYIERQCGSVSDPVTRSLKTDEVITDLQNRVGDVSSTISSKMKMDDSSQLPVRTSRASLLLSTDTLSQTTQETIGQVSQ